MFLLPPHVSGIHTRSSGVGVGVGLIAPPHVSGIHTRSSGMGVGVAVGLIAPPHVSGMHTTGSPSMMGVGVAVGLGAERQDSAQTSVFKFSANTGVAAAVSSNIIVATNSVAILFLICLPPEILSSVLELIVFLINSS